MDLVYSTVLPFIYNTKYSVHGCLMQIYPDSQGFIKIAYDDFFPPKKDALTRNFLQTVSMQSSQSSTVPVLVDQFE